MTIDVELDLDQDLDLELGLDLDPRQRQWVCLAEKLSSEFATRRRQYDQDGVFPERDFEQLRDAGFLGLAVPKEYGGESDDPGACMALVPYLVVRAIAHGSPGTAWCYMIHNHQVGTVARLGTPEQGNRILGDVARNGKLMGSGGVFVNPNQLSANSGEPGRPGVLSGDKQIEALDGGIRVSATSYFCSGAAPADYIASSGLAPGTQSAAEGGFQFIVPTPAEGLTITPGGWEEAVGLRCTETGSVTFDNVLVPWKNVIGQPGDFIQKDPYTFELSQAAQLLGSAEAALQFILLVMRERPYLLEDDSLVYETGRIKSMLHVGLASLLYSSRLWDEKRWGEAAQSSLCTMHVIREAAALIATKGFEIIGARSLMRFHPFEGLVRDMITAIMHTRESVHMRAVTEGAVSGGEFFAKSKYGPKIPSEQRKNWNDLGFPGPPDT